MRYWTRTLLAIASVFALSSCGEEVASVEETARGPVGELVVTESDSAGVAMVTISGSVAALPEWSLSETPLTEIRGDAPPYLTTVGEVAFGGEGRLLVYDRQSSELRSFGADGQVLQLLARAGDGPGELRNVTQLSVTPGDTVYTFDYRHYRISVFGPDGAFLTSTTVGPNLAGSGAFVRDAWALGSDRFFLLGYGLGPGLGANREGPPQLVVRDGVLQVVSADGTEHASPVRFAGDPVIYSGPMITASPFRPAAAAH